MKKILCSFAAILAGICAAFTASSAQAEVSFAGKRIVWVVPSGAGGGTDTMTRFFAPFFKKHLPGNPTVIIQNIPGAGTLPGINYVWQNGKDDGEMILSMTTGGQTNYVFGDKAVQYDLGKFQALIGLPQGTFVYGQSSLGLKGPGDIATLKSAKKDLTFGAQTPTSAELRMLIAWDSLGVKTKPVWGLSRGKSRQGFQRSEFELMYDTASGWVKRGRKLVKSGQAVPLFTFGVEDANGKIVRDPTEPKLPTFLEVYEQVNGKKYTGIGYKAWHMMFSIAVMNSKAVVLPRTTRKDVYDTYLAAVKRMTKDPKFIKAKKKRLGAYEMSMGKQAQATLKASADIDAPVCAWITNFLKTKYDTAVNCKK
jgi:tripartite-type tricarboxylate transporter receptor subunit TctC